MSIKSRLLPALRPDGQSQAHPHALSHASLLPLSLGLMSPIERLGGGAATLPAVRRRSGSTRGCCAQRQAALCSLLASASAA
jgi:hypothetical protein